MERGADGVAGFEVVGVDLEPPRQRRGPAEQLLVEVVAPAPDGLGERDRRGGTVAATAIEIPRRCVTYRPTTVPRMSPPGMPRPPCQISTTLPQVAPELLDVGGDVIQPGADDAGEHRPDGDRAGVVLGARFALLQPPAEQPHRGDDAEGDRQPVQVEAERSDLDRVERRARDAGDQDATCFTNAWPPSATIRSRS